MKMNKKSKNKFMLPHFKVDKKLLDEFKGFNDNVESELSDFKSKINFIAKQLIENMQEIDLSYYFNDIEDVYLE